VCPLGHETRGQVRCPVCGERLALVIVDHPQEGGTAADAGEVHESGD